MSVAQLLEFPTVGEFLIDDWETTDDWADLYLRMSENEEEGIRRQYAETIPWALAVHGLRIRRIIADNDRSATKDNVTREGFEVTIEDATARRAARGFGSFTKVVCWHSDRYARRVKDLLRVEEAGILVYGKNSGYFDLSTPAGVATAVTVTAWAEYEGKQKALRQRAAHAQRALQGRPFWTNFRPFGLTRDGQLIEEEAEALRRTYRQILAGDSLESCCRWLNKHGFKTVRGNDWQGGPLRTVLMHARNCGILCYDGKEVGPGNWPAIVDEATYRATVNLLTRPARQTNAGRPLTGRGGRANLLTGIAKCSVCEGTVTSANRKGKAGGTYRVYRCATGHISARADFVDSAARALLLSRFARSDVKDHFSPASGEDDQVVAGLMTQLARAREKREEYQEMFDNDEIDRVEYNDLKARNNEKIARLTRDLERRSLPDNALLRDLTDIENLQHHWDNELTIHQQAAIMKAFFEQIVIKPRGHGTGRLSRGHVLFWVRGEDEPRELLG